MVVHTRDASIFLLVALSPIAQSGPSGGVEEATHLLPSHKWWLF